MRPDPSLVSDLWCFRIAGECLSFAKCADRMSVTQSAVSQRIQRLEARLGLRLFDRGKSGLRLTRPGERLYRAIHAGFAEIETGLSAVSEDRALQPVLISCVPSLAISWLTPRLADWNRQHPDIAVSVMAEVEAADNAADGNGFDIAIRYGPSNPGGGRLVFEVPEKVYPVLSPDLMHTLAAPDPPETTLLHDAQPWARASSPTAEWDHWKREHALPHGEATRDVFVNLAHLSYQAAADGLGVALGRHLLVDHHLRNGSLVALEGAGSSETLKYFILTPPGPQRRDVELVLAWIGEQMAASYGLAH